VSSRSRRWLRLELGVGVAFLVLVAAGLLAPPLWRDYQERRGKLVVEIRADGTVIADGRKFQLELPVREPPSSSPTVHHAPFFSGDLAPFRELVQSRAKRLMPPAPSPRAARRPRRGKPYPPPRSKLEVRLRVEPQTACGLVQRIITVCRNESAYDVTVNDVRLPPGWVPCDSDAPSSNLCLTWRESRLEAFLVELPSRGSAPTAQAKKGELPELCDAVSCARVWIHAEDRVPLSDVLAAVRLLRDRKRDVRLVIGPNVEFAKLFVGPDMEFPKFFE